MRKLRIQTRMKKKRSRRWRDERSTRDTNGDGVETVSDARERKKGREMVIDMKGK